MVLPTTRFLRDRRGTVGMVLAVGAMPLLAVVVAAIGLGLQSTNYAEVQSVVNAACSRGRALGSMPADDREAAVLAVLDHHLPMAGLDIARSTYSASDNGSGLEVNVEGTATSAIAVFGSDHAIAVRANCDGAADPLIFFDSFEQPNVRDSGYHDWYVEPDLPNWRLVNGTGVGLTRYPFDGRAAFDGMQYVELDSSTDRGGITGQTTNSVIARTVALVTGWYRLSYAYHPQEMVGIKSDIGVATYLDPTGTVPRPSNEIARLRASISGWQIVSVDFSIDTPGEYDIGFAPLGPANGRSGFVDAVRLERIP